MPTGAIRVLPFNPCNCSSTVDVRSHRALAWRESLATPAQITAHAIGPWQRRPLKTPSLPADIRSMTGEPMIDPDEERAPKKGRERAPLTAERIAQIRARIDTGAYASDPVLTATARAILDRGDL